jgi:hypothetical protein
LNYRWEEARRESTTKVLLLLFGGEGPLIAVVGANALADKSTEKSATNTTFERMATESAKASTHQTTRDSTAERPKELTS